MNWKYTNISKYEYWDSRQKVSFDLNQMPQTEKDDIQTIHISVWLRAIVASIVYQDGSINSKQFLLS